MPAATHRDLAGLSAGDAVRDELYLVLQKDLRQTSNGSLYIHAVLADRSGQMVARMWNASQEIFDSIPASGLVRVTGHVETYRNKPQFIIDGLRAADEEGIDPAAFLPASEHDPDAMWERLKQILRTIEDRDLLALVGRFINDDTFAERFRRAPAARSNHHAYLGGLLEHTLSVLELALLVLPRYPRVNRDLVLAGIFLHDAGKTAELNCETNFDYTVEGQLLGHIVQAVCWVHEKAREIERETGRAFPREILVPLEHIIVAHHGRYEFGSPRLPATAEALMVHYLDNLDARMNMVFGAIDAGTDETAEFTDWVHALDTRVYRGTATRTAAEEAE